MNKGDLINEVAKVVSTNMIRQFDVEDFQQLLQDDVSTYFYLEFRIRI